MTFSNSGRGLIAARIFILTMNKFLLVSVL